MAVNIEAGWWPFGDPRPITYARNQTKIDQPLVEHLPSVLLEVEAMMNATQQLSQWKCIEQVIQDSNANNFSNLLFTMIKQPYLDRISNCYTSSNTSKWTTETIGSFEPFYYIIGSITVLGIIFLCLICKLCCILCKKKNDDDELD